MKRLEEKIEVRVHCGVHGRVAVRLAEIARDMEVKLHIVVGDQEVDCGSILQLLGLALVQGSRITVRADGVAAAEALQRVRDLLMEEED